MLRVGAGALTMLARGILTACEAGLLAACFPSTASGRSQETRQRARGAPAHSPIALRLSPRSPPPPKSDGGGSSPGTASQPFKSQSSRSSLSAFYWKGS